MSIIFQNGGSLTTVQDLGCIGYQDLGFSVSGAMDQHAFKLANALLSNEPNEAMLEITVLGPTFTFKKANCFVLTGAPMGAKLNDLPLVQNKVFQAKENDQIIFPKSFPKNGMRSYIAFAGGLEIPKLMGSCSTYLKGKMGGFHGRAIAEGDEIAFKSPKKRLPYMQNRVINEDFLSVYGWKDILVRVVLGPQDSHFTEESIDDFLSTPYTITPNCDRMGSRLYGKPLKHLSGADIISDGIAFGSIQVPSNGQPIILLADRQSTGGYTKIATVITADLHKISQRQIGNRIFFTAVSVQQAQQEFIKMQSYYDNLYKSFDKKFNIFEHFKIPNL